AGSWSLTIWTWLLLLSLTSRGPAVPGAQEDLPSVQIDPKDSVVRVGTSLNISCTSNCRSSDGNLGLETSMSKNLGSSGKGTMELSAQPPAPLIVLFSSTDPPEQVELMPPPAWVPVGENYTVDCQVLNVMPLENLTMALLQGTQRVGLKDFPGKLTGLQNATATFPLLARREDHGTNVSCQAELDLQRLGLDLFQGRSASVQLPWFNSSALSDSWVLEVGAATSVSCEAEVFPAWEAQVHLSLGGRELSPTVTWDGDRLTANAMVRAEEGLEHKEGGSVSPERGRGSLSCVCVSVSSEFLPPILTLSEESPLETTPVNVTCRPSQLDTSVKLEGQTEMPPGEPAHLQLIAREEDDGRVLSCEATMSVESVRLVKHQTVQLHVLYGPRMNASDCPGNLTWPEGTEQVLHCRAWGNPTPTVQCIHTEIKSTFFPGTLLQVTRAHAGTYRCTARSELGTEARDVIVRPAGENSNSGTMGAFNSPRSRGSRTRSSHHARLDGPRSWEQGTGNQPGQVRGNEH
uniref:Immunoglobulin domain-containing protein n=1 Tax=Ornithorhynchus anatinus TaxID=9258 RepID=F7EAI7_ORNAN